MLEGIDKLISNLPTITISGFALFYSIKSYKQSHKINNENILYQGKINAYKEIMHSLSDLLNTMNLYFYLGERKVLDNNLNEAYHEKLDEYADDIDKKTIEFDNAVKANAAILPNKILDKLENLSFDLFDTDTIDEMKKHNLSTYEKSLDDFYDKAEKLVGIFRKDLNSKTLNQELFKRIKK